MNTENKKYKTQLCRYFGTDKSCQLDDKCHFAHREGELRKHDDPINPESIPYANKYSGVQANHDGSSFRGKGGYNRNQGNSYGRMFNNQNNNQYHGENQGRFKPQQIYGGKQYKFQGPASA
jgi:hypothetical protein